jgi:hypothetical protein
MSYILLRFNITMLNNISQEKILSFIHQSKILLQSGGKISDLDEQTGCVFWHLIPHLLHHEVNECGFSFDLRTVIIQVMGM